MWLLNWAQASFVLGLEPPAKIWRGGSQIWHLQVNKKRAQCSALNLNRAWWRQCSKVEPGESKSVINPKPLKTRIFKNGMHNESGFWIVNRIRCSEFWGSLRCLWKHWVMEGLQKLIGKVSKDPPKLGNSSSSSSSSFDSHRAGEGLAAALSSSDQSRILFNRPARYLCIPISLLLPFTCSAQPPLQFHFIRVAFVMVSVKSWRDLFATNKCALEMEKWDFPKIGLVFLKLWIAWMPSN